MRGDFCPGDDQLFADQPLFPAIGNGNGTEHDTDAL